MKLSESNRRRRDEEADATQKLRAATTQVSRFRLELAEGKAEAAEKERLLAEHRSKVYRSVFMLERKRGLNVASMRY